MTTCDKLGPLLDGYHDGELDGLESRRVERHLEGCARCRSDLASLGVIGQAVRATVAGVPSPDLWHAIAAELPERTQRRAALRTALRRRWLPAAAAAAIAASLSLVLLDRVGLLLPAADVGPSGVVRSIYAPERPVLVLEAEKSEDPTIIWLMEGDRAEVAPHVGI